MQLRFRVSSPFAIFFFSEGHVLSRILFGHPQRIIGKRHKIPEVILISDQDSRVGWSCLNTSIIVFSVLINGIHHLRSGREEITQIILIGRERKRNEAFYKRIRLRSKGTFFPTEDIFHIRCIRQILRRTGPGSVYPFLIILVIGSLCGRYPHRIAVYDLILDHILTLAYRAVLYIQNLYIVISWLWYGLRDKPVVFSRHPVEIVWGI